MAAGDPSFRKINYLLRPSKQVERRLIAQALARLAPVGYPISTYRYIGLGSVYYADFVLFHRLLYIDDMWCVEAEDIPLAMEFNKPFEFIHLFMAKVATVIPQIDRALRHVVWLDYDAPLSDEVLDDFGQLGSLLPAGSILLVSINARGAGPDVLFEDEDCRSERLNRMLADAREMFSKYRRKPVQMSDLTGKGVARLYQAVLSARIDSELANRPGDRLKFYQLFSFRYADNAPMFTYGGVIDRPRLARRFDKAGLTKMDFIRTNPVEDPVLISVPMLTPRERHWLDQHLTQNPTVEGQFELDKTWLKNFRRYYREYPNYNEVVF